MISEKYVDESWKEMVSSEKETPPQQKQPAASEPPQARQPDRQPSGSVESADIPEITFIGYMTSLVYQGMIFLGEVPSPIDNTTATNLPQAQLIIDTLRMLKEKTAGNLTQQEQDAINAYVYELEMKYVEMSRKTGAQ